MTSPRTDAVPSKARYRWRLLLCVPIVIVAAWCSCFVISYAVLHTSDHAKAILNGVGRQVEFVVPPRMSPGFSRILRGTISHAGFQYEPLKTWVVYLHIGVVCHYDSGGGEGIRTILSPFELDRVRFIDDTSNQSLHRRLRPGEIEPSVRPDQR